MTAYQRVWGVRDPARGGNIHFVGPNIHAGNIHAGS